MNKVDFSKVPDKWTILLTRPNGGIVGEFGNKQSHCPQEFPRIDVYRHPPEASLPKDQVRSILMDNGIDPDVYERAQQLLRQAAQGEAPPAPAGQIDTIPAEVVKPLDEPQVNRAEVVESLNVEPAIAFGLVEPVGVDVANPAIVMATTEMVLPKAASVTEPDATAQSTLF